MVMIYEIWGNITLEKGNCNCNICSKFMFEFD